MKTYLLFISLLAGTIHSSFAQVNDAQFWENVNLEKNINPRLLFRVVQEGRITDNFRSASFNYFDFGLSRKFNKHIHGTIAYVWAEKRRPDESWSPRHQVYAYLSFKKKIKDLTLVDRQMVLWQVKDYNTSLSGKIPDYYLRNKVTVRYDRYFKLAPYLAAEIYYKANSKERAVASRFDRLRAFAGLFYRTDKANEFEVYYLFEKHLNTANPQTNWVLGLGYTHSF